MKEKVIAVLCHNDSLRTAASPEGIPSRAEFVAYLTEVFSKAEAYDSLAARVAALENK